MSGHVRSEADALVLRDVAGSPGARLAEQRREQPDAAAGGLAPASCGDRLCACPAGILSSTRQLLLRLTLCCRPQYLHSKQRMCYVCRWLRATAVINHSYGIPRCAVGVRWNNLTIATKQPTRLLPDKRGPLAQAHWALLRTESGAPFFPAPGEVPLPAQDPPERVGKVLDYVIETWKSGRPST